MEHILDMSPVAAASAAANLMRYGNALAAEILVGLAEALFEGGIVGIPLAIAAELVLSEEITDHIGFIDVYILILTKELRIAVKRKLHGLVLDTLVAVHREYPREPRTNLSSDAATHDALTVDLMKNDVRTGFEEIAFNLNDHI